MNNKTFTVRDTEFKVGDIAYVGDNSYITKGHCAYNERQHRLHIDLFGKQVIILEMPRVDIIKDGIFGTKPRERVFVKETKTGNNYSVLKDSLFNDRYNVEVLGILYDNLAKELAEDNYIESANEY